MPFLQLRYVVSVAISAVWASASFMSGYFFSIRSNTQSQYVFAPSGVAAHCCAFSLQACFQASLSSSLHLLHEQTVSRSSMGSNVRMAIPEVCEL